MIPDESAEPPPPEGKLEEFLRRLEEEEEEALARLRRLLVDARERDRSLQALLREPYLVTDPGGEIREMNRPAVELLKAGPVSELEGQELETFIAEARVPAFRDRLTELAHGAETGTFETVISTPNRQPVRVEATPAPVRDSRGEVVVLRWLLRDISEQRRAEQTTRQLVQSEADRAAAERAEQRFRILSETSRILGRYLESAEPLQEVVDLVAREQADYCAVWLEEEDGLREVASAGRPDEGADFLPVRQRLRLDPEDPNSPLRAAVSTDSAHVVAATDPGESDLEVFPVGVSGPGGPRRALIVPLSTSGGPGGVLVLADRGAGPGFGREDLVLAEQLADRIAMAVEQSRLYRATVAARGERDHVRKVVSHDLHNALNAVVVSLEQAGVGSDEEAGGEDRARWLNRAYEAARRMSRLIDDLDRLADRDQVKLELDKTACRPEVLLRDAVEMFQAKATRAGASLHRDVEPDLPSVAADRGRVGQVLSNLVENALRFTPHGGEIHLEAAAGDGEMVVFSVEDSGPGIAEEDLPRVFERFWSRSREGSRTGVGSGLGLSIARNLVEAHGGTIQAENAEGGGARVVFTLPAAGESEGS